MVKKLDIRKFIANEGDQSHYDGKRWVLHFGAYGCTAVLVYSDHLQNALDECAAWLDDNAPGLFCDDYIKEEFDRLKLEGKTDEQAMEEAEIDTTSIGGYGQHITSHEWHYTEDPTRDDLARIFKV